jgi:hypothetical protein
MALHFNSSEFAEKIKELGAFFAVSRYIRNVILILSRLDEMMIKPTFFFSLKYIYFLIFPKLNDGVSGKHFHDCS